MPDQSDVEDALAALVAGALYPAGPSRASVVGSVVRVFRGWPVASALAADLAAEVVQVAVQPVANSWRDASRYSNEWQVTRTGVPTMVGEVVDEAVQFTGQAAAGQVAGLRVDGRAYAYRVRDGDAAGLVAAVLADLVRADRPAVLSGARVELPGGVGLAARVVADGFGGQELSRQTMGFRVAVWAPDFATRDRVAACIERALAGTPFLDVRGWGCRMLPGGGAVTDEGAPAGMWRRDAVATIEFPTVAEADLSSMLFGVSVVNGVAALA